MQREIVRFVDVVGSGGLFVRAWAARMVSDPTPLRQGVSDRKCLCDKGWGCCRWCVGPTDFVNADC